MNSDESPISSVHVQLGMPTPKNASTRMPQQPWAVLVCSNLGFSSKRPVKIAAATLNELLENECVTVSGAVETDLPEGVTPFYLEYRIKHLKDFSPAALRTQLPFFTPLNQATVLLKAISDKRVPAAEGLQKIAALTLPASIRQQLSSLNLPKATTDIGHPASPAAAIDSILSMVNITPPAEAAPTDFVAALSDNAAACCNPAAVTSCLLAIEQLIEKTAITVAAQPFFQNVQASWSALKDLLKVAGRDSSIVFHLSSAPADAAPDHLEAMIGYCITDESTPDIILWDYPCELSTAATAVLDKLGILANRYKSLLVTSLDSNDPIHASIIANEPLQTTLQQPMAIPLGRLRQKEHARCIALCTPAARKAALVSGTSDGLLLSGGWFLLLQWASACIEQQDPFHLQNSSALLFETIIMPKLTRATIAAAAANGITALQPKQIAAPVVLLDAPGSPYQSMLYNLLVNRVTRLTAEWTSSRESHTADQTAPALEQFLKIHLEPYGILTCNDAVSVTKTDLAQLTVTINSKLTIDVFPVQIQFSLPL